MSEQSPETSARTDGAEASTDLGMITVNHGVIAAIARAAALKVPGVHDMSASFVDGLAGIIGKGASDRGIRVEEDDQAVAITLHVLVAFGVRIPRVAWQLQNDVRTAVEDMTGKKVKAVNVVVQGVHMPEAPAEEAVPS
jgi:uncharacterized alkaline shock family protein YloU